MTSLWGAVADPMIHVDPGEGQRALDTAVLDPSTAGYRRAATAARGILSSRIAE